MGDSSESDLSCRTNLLPGLVTRKTANPERPSLVAGFLFYGLDIIPLGNDGQEFWKRMSAGTFKNRPILNQISVTIQSSVRILHCGHVVSNEHYGRGIHRTGNLVNYIFNRIAIANYPAIINVTANEKHFLNNWGKLVC